MRFFRRKNQEEQKEDESEALTTASEASEETEAEEAAERRRWLPLRRRREPEAEPQPQPQEEEPLRPRKANGPLSQDEAHAPLAVEVAGSRHFTVILGQPHDPDRPPLEIPSLSGKGKRRLFWKQRLSPEAEVEALVGVLEDEKPEKAEEPQEIPETPTVEEEEAAETVQAAAPVETGALVETPSGELVQRSGLLIGALFLAAAALGVLVRAGVLPAGGWWPLALVVVGGLLALSALLARDEGRLLGGASLVALGVGGLASIGAGLVVALGVTVFLGGALGRLRA